MKIELVPKCELALTYEDYSVAPDIEGVFYLPLRKHRALEGWFMEYLRLSGGLVEGLPIEFTARQISFSDAVANRVNAFHIHPKAIQDELWCVTRGTLKVWLVDLRENSSTKYQKKSYVLSGETPGFLHIPTGVAHGYKAGGQGAFLVYVMNSQFSLSDPNEGRLPWDYFGAELWDDNRG